MQALELPRIESLKAVQSLTTPVHLAQTKTPATLTLELQLMRPKYSAKAFRKAQKKPDAWPSRFLS